MSRGLLLLTITFGIQQAACQLRPRRVGTSALGEQQEAAVPDAEFVDPMPAQMGGGDNDVMAAMAEMMNGGGENKNAFGDLLKASMQNLENNPMLQKLAQANPELSKLMSDPAKLEESMNQMAELMSSPEGQNMAKNMMSEMQSVLTDPDKLAAGLQQLQDNPELKGLADAVPGLKDMLDDPEKMQEQVAKTAELFRSLEDPDKMAELVSQVSELVGEKGGENLMQGLQALMGGDADPETMENLLGGLGNLGGGGGGEGDDMQQRVRNTLASMLQQRGGAADGELGDAGDDFEQF